jgi:hypothetical protein
MALQYIGSFFSGLWQWFSGVFSGFVSFIDEWLIQPIKNAFSSVWDWIVGLFDKIMNKLSAVFAPVKKLLGEIFSSEGMTDVKAAYKEGEKKGAASFDKDHPNKKTKKAKPKADNKKGAGMDVANMFDVTKGAVPKAGTIGGAAAKSVKEKGEGKSGKTVGNLSITKLVETINIYNQNGMAMDKEAIVKAIREALLTGVADYTLALDE